MSNESTYRKETMSDQTRVVEDDAPRWTHLADGRRVQAAVVAALDRFDAEVWPGATFPGARAAIVAVVQEALRAHAGENDTDTLRAVVFRMAEDITRIKRICTQEHQPKMEPPGTKTRHSDGARCVLLNDGDYALVIPPDCWLVGE